MCVRSGRKKEMKGIITVLGKDKVGIIANVCTYLSGSNINILDISQNIVDGYFNMTMIVDIEKASKPLDIVSDEMANLGETIGVQIKIQHEDVFNCMHRI